MPNFTEEQYDSLLAAIASGATSVTYSGKTVSYRSISEMIHVAKLMRVSLGLEKSNRSTTLRYQCPRARY